MGAIGGTGIEELVVGIDVRCLRAGLDGLAGVGIHTWEIVRRLLAAPREGVVGGDPGANGSAATPISPPAALPGKTQPALRIVPFAGSRWRSRVRECFDAGKAPITNLREISIPGRVLEKLWRKLHWPPLEWLLGRCDLLHGPDYFLPPHRCVRRVLTVHDLAVLRHPEYASDSFRRRFERELDSWRRPGTSFIAVSDFTRSELQALLGISAERIHVVPNGVAEDFRAVGESPHGATQVLPLRASLLLPTRFLLGVGSIQPRKNLLNLLRAMRILRDRSKRPEPLILCGNQEWLSGPIREEARKLGDAVRFVTLPRGQMPLLYAAARALIYPSFYEGFGLPILEAMASGTPVGASRVPSHEEVVGSAGLFFPPEDPEAMAAVMDRLLGDDELHSQLSAAGRARAALFPWDRTAAGTMQVYRTVLAEPEEPQKPAVRKQAAVEVS